MEQETAASVCKIKPEAEIAMMGGYSQIEISATLMISLV